MVVPPDDPPLIARANARFMSSFRQTVRSVLRDASVASLRRTMSRRVRESMTRPPPPEEEEEPTTMTTGRMRTTTEDPRRIATVLEVSYEDIEACHRLAGRVGRMWAEVLRDRGYVELAEAASSVAGEGRFLGGERGPVGTPTSAEAGSAAAVAAAAVAGGGRGGRRTTTGGGYASTHAAARSLRRRPPDCDGSGLPSGRLLPASSDSDDGDDGTGSPSRAAAASGDAGRSSLRRGGGSSATSARGAIRRVDDMVRNGTASWEYGWDAIEEAVARNGERIYYSRAAAARSSGVDDDDDVADGGGGSRGNEGAGRRRKRGRCSDGGRMKAVRFENDGDRDDADGDDEDDSRGDGGIRDVNVSMSANEKAASISKRRGGAAGHEEAPPIMRNVHDESNCNGVGASDRTDGRGAAFGELEGGRPPSSIGQETFRWDDLVEEMTTEERRRLILSAIHPPHPFESEMDGGGAALDDAHFDAIVCGALKEVGETHLWEQTRRFPASDGGGGGGEGENSESEEHAVGVPNRSGTEGGRGTTTTALYGVSEARASFRSQERARRRKRAMARATRERLGRRIESINEHRASYAKAVACSKVRWTEDDVAHPGMETMDGETRSADSTLPPRRGDRSGQRPRKWLEMDLGECTIELVDGEERAGPVEDGGGGNGEGAKRFLAFRSLEVALMN